jgi:hypothetical protein
MRVSHWGDKEAETRNLVAFCNITMINSLRVGNNIKFRLLFAAGPGPGLAIYSRSQLLHSPLLSDMRSR